MARASHLPPHGADDLQRERRKQERPDGLKKAAKELGDICVIIDGRRGRGGLVDSRSINQRVQVDHQYVAEKEGLAEAGGVFVRAPPPLHWH